MMLWIVVSIFAACRSEPSAGPEPADNTVSIAYLKSLYERSAVIVDGEVFIRGRVVSTDQYGAFYNTLYVEDSTGAIAVRVDMENYHRIYFRGMEVVIACNSLMIDSYGGMLRLGVGSPDGFVPIPQWRVPSVVSIVEGTDISPVPTMLTIGELSARWIGCYAAFECVQFTEPGQTWSNEDAGAATNRTLVDCNGFTLTVRTSAHASFAGHLLPSGSGYIEGIITYFNGEYQLEVCSHTVAIMTGERFPITLGARSRACLSVGECYTR